MSEINLNNMEKPEDIQKYIETLTRTVENLKDIISTLNEKITNLEKENLTLREENQDLRSKVPNVGNLEKVNEMYRIKIDELEREIKIYKKNQEIFEAEKTVLRDNKGDVFELQKKIIDLENQNKKLLEKTASINKSYDIETKQPAVKEIRKPKVEILESPTEGRRKCPNCKNDTPASIHELVDKTKILMDYPRMYGKKYKCGECGMEWR